MQRRPFPGGFSTGALPSFRLQVCLHTPDPLRSTGAVIFTLSKNRCQAIPPRHVTHPRASPQSDLPPQNCAETRPRCRRHHRQPPCLRRSRTPPVVRTAGASGTVQHGWLRRWSPRPATRHRRSRTRESWRVGKRGRHGERCVLLLTTNVFYV